MSKQESHSAKAPTVLMAELLYETKPDLFAGPVFARVQSLLPNAELISKPDADIALIAHPDHMIQCNDGPCQIRQPCSFAGVQDAIGNLSEGVARCNRSDASLDIRWHRMICSAELLSASGSSKPHVMERLAINVRFHRISNPETGDLTFRCRNSRRQSPRGWLWPRGG